MSAQFVVANNRLLCSNHQNEYCEDCDVDYRAQNNLAAYYSEQSEPESPNFAAKVQEYKNLGNVQHRAGESALAVESYTKALDMALSRPLWLSNEDLLTETTIIMSNRAAAHLEIGQYEESLADAISCTGMRRGWSKGWFRKGRALEALGRYEQAIDSYLMGVDMAMAEGDERGMSEMSKAAARLSQ